jgi:hypothetical protein
MTKTQDFHESTDEDLVRVYREAAEEQARFFTDFNHVKANKAARRLAAAYRELRTRGSAAQARLLPLLEHPEPGVRAWAAAHALEFAPERGEPVLSALVDQGGLIGLGANETLKAWRGATLTFT